MCETRVLTPSQSGSRLSADHSEARVAQGYAPAKQVRKKLPKNAAIGGAISTYSVTTNDALAAPGDLTFGEFIRQPAQVERIMYGHRAASCAAQLLHEFREEFAGEAKRRDLINCVRKNHLGGRPGFRFWNRIGAGIWQHYLGRKRNKAWNSRAQDREVERLQRAAERARRDTKRSKLRRKPRNEADAQVLKAAKLNHKIDWLAERETQKRAQAAALLNEAAHLEREIMHLRAAHEEVCRD